MKFSEILALVGLAPKTLPQAKEALDSSKAALSDVAAMFATAGLDLEQMLAAGPDALKAHLESIDNSEELAEALQENEKVSIDLTALSEKLEKANAVGSACNEIFAAVGFKTDTLTAEAFKPAFEAHVSKQTTLALAKTGHPPAHVPAAVETVGAAKSNADLHAEWKAMKAGPERLEFFTKHEAAITAHERAA